MASDTKAPSLAGPSVCATSLPLGGAPHSADPPVDLTTALEGRLEEGRATGRLNLGYLGLNTLPSGAVTAALEVEVGGRRLVELDLSSNGLVDLPAELSALSSLTLLRLKYNALTMLPRALATLPRLAVLEADSNRVAVLDVRALAGMTALRSIDLSGNGMRSIEGLEDCKPLSSLEKLALGANALGPALPPALASALPNLLQLDISSNGLAELPQTLSSLARLQRLDAKNNEGLGRLPPQLGLLPGLKALDTRGCRLVPRYQASGGRAPSLELDSQQGIVVPY